MVTHRSSPVIRRRLAFVLLFISVACSLLYTLIDEVILKTSVGAWPTVLALSAFAILASCLTRDWIISPLCCFAGVMAGDLLAVVVRSWSYAQVEMCIPIAAGFSIPSFGIAIAIRCYQARNAPDVA